MNDPQAVLLNFVGQELVAHSATVLACLVGGFTFLYYFRPKGQRWVLLLYSLVGAILLSFAVYSGLRLVWYGRLASSAIGVTPSAGECLRDYLARVDAAASHGPGPVGGLWPLREFLIWITSPCGRPLDSPLCLMVMLAVFTFLTVLIFYSRHMPRNTAEQTT